MRLFHCVVIILAAAFHSGCVGHSRYSVVNPPVLEQSRLPEMVDGEKAVAPGVGSRAEVVSEEVHFPANQPVSMPGVVFGKTDFSGLLKTAYVQLAIVSLEDSQRQYVFSVGNRADAALFPWSRETRVIEPGYFVLELPPGPYKMTQLAIPAGTSLAREDMELDFVVTPGRVNYLGTLKVVGKKGRIRFGGIPLIRPGFDYELSVIDELSLATREASGLLPKGVPVDKGLFRVVAMAPEGIPTEGVLRRSPVKQD